MEKGPVCQARDYNAETSTRGLLAGLHQNDQAQGKKLLFKAQLPDILDSEPSCRLSRKWVSPGVYSG